MDRDPDNRDFTANPIYLLQRRSYQLIDDPDWLGVGDDGEWLLDMDLADCPSWVQDDPSVFDDHRRMWEALKSVGDAIEIWDVDSVWLTRPEAEAFGNATSYNFPLGYRVWCDHAKGRLADVLNDLPEEGGRLKCPECREPMYCLSDDCCPSPESGDEHPW